MAVAASRTGRSTVERAPRAAAALYDLAELYLEVFRACPYLYDGSAAYGQCYLSDLLSGDRAALIAAKDNGRTVGMAIALGLSAQPACLQQPLASAGYDVSRTRYFGETVLIASYRRLGIGSLREHAARKAGATHTRFCALIRDDWPAEMRDRTLGSELFWRSQGCTPVAAVETVMA